MAAIRDSQIGRYLKAQTDLNTALEYNSDSGILYDATSTTKSHISTALVAGAGLSRLDAAKYAPFVGQGMLAGVSVAPASIESDGKNPTAKSTGAQLLRLADALRTNNKAIELTSIGPADTAIVHGLNGVANLLEVRDGVEGDDANDSTSLGVGMILSIKICGALASMGYDAHEIEKVGKLVQDNLMTATPYAEQVAGSATVRNQVKRVLRTLVDPHEQRARSVNMNSNEPVLLINNFGTCSEMKLGGIVTEALEQLHRQYNIWPVRVYAGRFVEHDAPETFGFSITLLNVVNTNLGGPSMIQLLDNPCNARGWNACMRKEIWDGRNLLARKEKPDDEATALPRSSSPSTVDEPEDEAVGNVLSLTKEDIAKKNSLKTFYEHVDVPDNTGDPDGHVEGDRTPMPRSTSDHSIRSESLMDLVHDQGSEVTPEHGDGDGELKGDPPHTREDSFSSQDTDFKRDSTKSRQYSTSSEGYVVL